MFWIFRRSFGNFRNIFRKPLGRGSIYRLERLRSVMGTRKNKNFNIEKIVLVWIRELKNMKNGN